MRSVILIQALALIVMASCTINNDREELILWYDEPADLFEESLVLGNGQMGASVFGGVTTDSIYLNEATLWSGEPVDPWMNPEAYKNLPAIRDALASENYELADKLNRKLQGSFSQSFAPMGTMYLDFDHSSPAENYYRELNIENAVSTVRYSADGVNYSREYFISHPDKIMIIRLRADKEDALDFKIRFNSLLKYEYDNDNNTFKINGYAPYHVEPNYRGDMPDAVLFDRNRGTRFSTYLAVKNKGRMEITDSTLHVSHSDDVIIYIAAATSFNGFDKDPAGEGLDNMALAEARLRDAMDKGYDASREDHISDYRSFFDRVELCLDKGDAPALPTDERLKSYTEGANDMNLEELYFQFGRYLLISSSRTPSVPANLQGIWNPYLRPPWSSNYTMNINVQENYWLAELTNLSEMHQPFLDFIGNLAITGEVTAKTFYGAERGWAACHNSDIWAMSNPVGDFGGGHPCWANWNMSGAWTATHLWEHYLFTGDRNFLEDYAWPLIKGAAEFCLDWLIEDKDGHLVSSPSTSPENIYITDTGYRGATLYGSASDHAMIRQCFLDAIKASEALGKDQQLRDELVLALEKLYPYQVSSTGKLQEWYHDWDDADPRHRHQSHLFGLFPGSHISPELSPELAEACKTTLEIKGDESTGWSKGWRINLWARLGDGNRAYKMYRELLSYVDPSGLETNYSGGGGTYPNLLDAHPPFQIDGNFGGAAGVAEMLIQSTANTIDLLPALPEAWSSGSVKGLCARGGFEVSVTWEDMKPVNVEVIARQDGKTVLRHGTVSREIELKKGKSINLDW